MMPELNTLRKLLCERLCTDITIDRHPDGDLMVRTHFEFPDGDRYSIHLSESSHGGLRLSDRGSTLMHISYEHEVDAFLDGTRGALLERIMSENDLQWDGGALCLDTTPKRLPEAISRFGQSLTRVYDLTLLARSNVGSTFYDDMGQMLAELVDESAIEADYQPDVPNAEAYPVDFRIQVDGPVPLFVYGVPNRDKARLTTIMLAHFHRHGLEFDSLLIFEDQTEIPRLDLARLSDVGGDMISSLASREDLGRKLARRAAA